MKDCMEDKPVLSPFCDNPLCRLNTVMVTGACTSIERGSEKHLRYFYQVTATQRVCLCPVCDAAVQVLMPKQEEKAIITPERKLVLVR